MLHQTLSKTGQSPPGFQTHHPHQHKNIFFHYCVFASMATPKLPHCPSSIGPPPIHSDPTTAATTTIQTTSDNRSRVLISTTQYNHHSLVCRPSSLHPRRAEGEDARPHPIAYSPPIFLRCVDDGSQEIQPGANVGNDVHVTVYQILKSTALGQNRCEAANKKASLPTTSFHPLLPGIS